MDGSPTLFPLPAVATPPADEDDDGRPDYDRPWFVHDEPNPQQERLDLGDEE